MWQWHFICSAKLDVNSWAAIKIMNDKRKEAATNEFNRL